MPAADTGTSAKPSGYTRQHAQPALSLVGATLNLGNCAISKAALALSLTRCHLVAGQATRGSVGRSRCPGLAAGRAPRPCCCEERRRHWLIRLNAPHGVVNWDVHPKCAMYKYRLAGAGIATVATRTTGGFSSQTWHVEGGLSGWATASRLAWGRGADDWVVPVVVIIASAGRGGIVGQGLARSRTVRPVGSPAAPSTPPVNGSWSQGASDSTGAACISTHFRNLSGPQRLSASLFGSCLPGETYMHNFWSYQFHGA